mgnify:CR=1 FL=1
MIELGFFQVGIAYVFLLVLMGLLRLRGIPRGREALIASFRMTLQLILAGYLLAFVFQRPAPWITLLLVCGMELFAIRTILGKFQGRMPKGLSRAVAIAMLTGTFFALGLFLYGVVQIRPWFDPQYVIPIAGMIIGNAMTGISLGVKTLIEEMQARRQLVEEALVLGAAPMEATREMADRAFEGALLPTINSMMGTGIVFLPGMMTGQILAGASPQVAITYQIGIMLGIFGAVGISVFLFLQLGYRYFFNEQQQLQ